MSLNLVALAVDAVDPERLAVFWSRVLGRVLFGPTAEGVYTLGVNDESDFEIDFAATTQPKWGANQLHFDLTSNSATHQQELVERALALGATHLDVGQSPDEGHVVLADPEGNEFCVIEPQNTFLAGCGPLGALAGDGTLQVGYFWRDALGWPLVWDQDAETAIQSPRGGPKITWGGPPVAAKLGKNRLHFDVAPPSGGDQLREVGRLTELGATRLDIGQGDVPWVVMADPDGNEFCVLTPRALPNIERARG